MPLTRHSIVALLMGAAILGGCAIGSHSTVVTDEAAPLVVAHDTAPAASPTAEELLESACRPGPWKVATLREGDGIRNGPKYRGGTIHYPTAADGSLADSGPFPIVVVCPGYLGPESTMLPWGRFLASHGIVTMTLGTNRPGDRPRVRAAAILDAIETVRAENTRAASPLNGQLAVDRTGAAGWSMGGGGAQHAAVLDESLKGVIAWVPWEPGVKFNHAVPVLILAGEDDRIASTRRHARPHFESTPDSTPKLLFEIRDGRHSLPRRPGNHAGEVGAWTLIWIKTFVEGDEDYRAVLDGKPSTASIYELSLP